MLVHRGRQRTLRRHQSRQPTRAVRLARPVFTSTTHTRSTHRPRSRRPISSSTIVSTIGRHHGRSVLCCSGRQAQARRRHGGQQHQRRAARRAAHVVLEPASARAECRMQREQIRVQIRWLSTLLSQFSSNMVITYLILDHHDVEFSLKMHGN